MIRSTLPQLLAATALVSSLAGCVIVDKSSTPMVGYSGATEPSSVSARYPWNQIAVMEGSTLYDAHHQVKRYLTLHFPDAKLVSVRADQVGANGKIAKTSDWVFTYQAVVRPVVDPTPSPTASPSYAAQAVSIPTQYDVRLLTFTFTGDGKLLAPEADTRTMDAGQIIDFDRLLYFNTVIETCLDIGMGMGSAGMQVALRPTANGGAVFEIDTSVSGREVSAYNPKPSATPSGYSGYGEGRDGSYRQPTPAPSASPVYYRGKYVIDAYTGSILERPTRL